MTTSFQSYLKLNHSKRIWVQFTRILKFSLSICFGTSHVGARIVRTHMIQRAAYMHIIWETLGGLLKYSSMLQKTVSSWAITTQIKAGSSAQTVSCAINAIRPSSAFIIQTSTNAYTVIVDDATNQRYAPSTTVNKKEAMPKKCARITASKRAIRSIQLILIWSIMRLKSTIRSSSKTYKIRYTNSPSILGSKRQMQALEAQTWVDLEAVASSISHSRSIRRQRSTRKAFG